MNPVNPERRKGEALVDVLHPFDLNAFIQQLIEETGATHTWEPVRTVVPEGQRLFGMTIDPEAPAQDPEMLAKREARQLFWMVWERLGPLMAVIRIEETPEMVAGRFADAVIDNMDLFRAVEAGFRDGNGEADCLS